MRKLLPLIALLVAAPAPARALPAFARRYQTGCTTCHVQFPKLNPFGEAFRRNGYQYPGGRDAAQLGGRPVTLVAEPYREVFPKSFWPSDLAESLPAAFTIEAQVPVFPDQNARPVGEQAFSFDRLYGKAQLLVGARLGTDVALFGSVSLDSASGFELERGFLTVSNLLFGPNHLHVRAGQFEPQLFSFSDYRRIGGPKYLLTSSSGAGAPIELAAPHSHWNAAFVRGVNLSGTLAGRVGWDAAWVQGVEGSYSGAAIQQIPRDGYGHLYFKLGGMSLDGDEPPGGTDPNPVSGERSLQIGAFFYGGAHDVDTANDLTKPPEPDTLYKVGGDALARFGRLELLLAAAYERHQFARLGPIARTQALAEATLLLFPWLSAVVRAEAEHYFDDVSLRITPMLVAHPRINWKLQLWAQIEREHGRDPWLKEIVLMARYAF